MQEHAAPPQPNFVMPPRPTWPGAHSRIVNPTSFPYALTRRCYDEIRQAPSSPQLPAIQCPCYTCVSYDLDTAALQMLHFSDTNHLSTDTKSVACPYLSVDAKASNIPVPHHDEIRQASLPPQFPGIRRPLYTCVSYAPATTTLQIRHLSDTNHFSLDTKSVELSNVLLSGPTTPPAPDSRPASRRNPPTPSCPRNLPSWNSLVQYEPAMAVGRMGLLSDTNNILTDTNGVPLPICHGTVIRPNSRPIRPNYHYEIRSYTTDYRTSCQSHKILAHPARTQGTPPLSHPMTTAQ